MEPDRCFLWTSVIYSDFQLLGLGHGVSPSLPPEDLHLHVSGIALRTFCWLSRCSSTTLQPFPLGSPSSWIVQRRQTLQGMGEGGTGGQILGMPPPLMICFHVPSQWGLAAAR